MNFFITGNSAVEAGLNLDFISPANARFGNFASKGQTVSQSYSIAQNVFQLVDKSKINFVLIGLTADSLLLDADERLTVDSYDDNLKALDDYIKLCLDNGAKPICVIFPFAPTVRERYRVTFLKPLFELLTYFEERVPDFKAFNFFDMELPQEAFSDERHLTDKGASGVSFVLTFQLYKQNIFTVENLAQINYSYFYYLSHVMDKINFHALLSKVFSYSVEKLRRKKKIKIAFVADHAANWCGDRLYNLFAQNDRFETTVFIIKGTESTLEDARHDFEQFKSAGLNVVGVPDLNEETEPQDIVFFLRPYQGNFSKNFQFDVLTPQTLCIYIPYYIGTVPGFLTGYYHLPIFHLAWKYFFEAKSAPKVFAEKSQRAPFCGVVSGLPKMDFFFKSANKSSFTWKMFAPPRDVAKKLSGLRIGLLYVQGKKKQVRQVRFLITSSSCTNLRKRTLKRVGLSSRTLG